MSDSDVLDDLFHGCAFQAFLEIAKTRQGWPDTEATRALAYRHYEDALASSPRNRRYTKYPLTR